MSWNMIGKSCRDQVDLTTLVSKYNTILEKIYNDLVPMKLRWITHQPHAPWYNDDRCLA